MIFTPFEKYYDLPESLTGFLISCGEKSFVVPFQADCGI